MIPTSVTGLLLLVAVLAPGYLWVLYTERRFVRPNRTGIQEVAELLVVGVVATTSAAVSLLGVAELFDKAPTLAELAKQRGSYFEAHPWLTVIGVSVVVLLACLGSWFVAWLMFRKQEANISHTSAWHRTLGVGAKDQPVRVAVDLKDGRTVEGYVWVYDLETSDSRSIALQRPIKVRVERDGSYQEFHQKVDRVVVEASSISTIWVVYGGSTRTNSTS